MVGAIWWTQFVILSRNVYSLPLSVGGESKNFRLQFVSTLIEYSGRSRDNF